LTSRCSYASAVGYPRRPLRTSRTVVLLTEAAARFVDTLRDASTNPVVVARLPAAQHAFDLFASHRFNRVIDAIDVFRPVGRAHDGRV
jgi:hypothetical protein